ncbi:MAG: adenylate/guanylate cyclase domain-containing protein [Kouleothrix sp.]|nr:adenylate/guanylate cyclase domain-containing protein [Kouleothrix sp.]
MPDLPTGSVTFLFTDIEGSTRLWELYPAAMPAAIDRHDTILRQAIAAGDGVVFRTAGDAFCAAFGQACAALNAALQAQLALHGEPWGAIGLAHERPMRVRMSLHTSTVELRDGEYFGPPLNRVARLLVAAHGGQTLLCSATYDRVHDHLPPGVTLRDMDEHRLRDLSRPERIFQLVVEGLPHDFPPLKTITTQQAHGAVAPRQAKLPGMPGVDYDAVWRKEKERERQRKKRKGKSKGEPPEGLF